MVSLNSLPVVVSSNEIVVPFHLSKDGFPLIDGKVDGKPGVFMLDTGSPYAFILNRHYVSLDEGVQVSNGKFASGQTVSVRRHAGRHRVELANVSAVLVSSDDRQPGEEALSIDASRQQTNIDPRFLGSVGWGWLGRYVVTLDYRAEVARFTPVSLAPPAMRSKASFSTAFRPSSPVIPFNVTVGGVVVGAVLDTAGWDRLALAKSDWATVTASGALKDGPGLQCVTVASARINGRDIDLVDLGKAERNEARLTLGVGFLRRFTSVWDPRDGTVTLTPNGAEPERMKDCS